MKSFPCPKDHIHQDHNKSRHGYRCPKPHIDSEQLRSFEQIHPYCVPIDCHIMHTPFLLQQLPKMTHIGFLNTGRQHHIQQNAGDQVSKISCGEGDKSEHFSQCGKGDDRQYRDAGKVSNVTGAEARLWINGSFGVRIMWITSVWLHMDSTNHPAWNMAA